MKKFLSLILAGLMSISCAMFVAADDAAEEAVGNPAETYAIEFLANHGIFKGSSTESFVADAESAIQRYQMALFVSRISTGWVDDDLWEDGTLNASTFKDIDTEPANKYLGALSYANQNGIIEGYTANTFAPYDGITYQDALTMVVRTLGYTGLSYPWGYIEKAVELSLCNGVDASYTAELTRGQVALIIYNAMFADTKSGDTLAKKVFGVDFGWETIVIVASGKDAFAINAGASAYKDYVGFQTVNADGTLSGKTYYVAAEELGLDGHKDDLAIGHAYLALFEMQKGDIVKVVDADSLLYKTVKNIGSTDNEGVEVATMPIAAELADYEQVTKYSTTTHNNATITLNTDNELILCAPKTVTYHTGVYGGDYNVGIDWNTQNIVTLRKGVAKDGEDADKYYVDDIAWYYNQTLDRYYRLLVTNTKAPAEGGILYIDWMSDAEFAAWYNEKQAARELTNDIFQYALGGTEGKDVYAKLQMFDVDFDGLADRALYKTYRIGTFKNTTAKCGTCDADKAAYKVEDLDGNVVVGATIADTACSHGFAWITVDESVIGFVNEDGSYNDGVVVYNYNRNSGELEIVKYVINEGTDADSYYVTGTLEAYSTANATVTISGTKYPLGYAALPGVVYGNVKENMASRTLYAASLDEYYMQYVEAIVVDGKVVDIDLVTGDKENDVIVVLGYAGQTNDGYWAVYGYSTFNTGVSVYKINTFNGWKRGDYKYYPANIHEDAAFLPGALYEIKSFDAETQSYNVYTQNVENVKDLAKATKITFDRGYRIIDVTGAEKIAYEVMSASDKYIIIDTYGVINVWDGVVINDNWSIKGNAVKINGAYVFYIDDNSEVVGLRLNAYELGYVYYDGENGQVLEAAFDSAIGDFYLLGSTQSSVRVYNMITGNTENVLVANNIVLKKNTIYKTIGNTIVDEFTVDAGFFPASIGLAYQDHDPKTATYMMMYNIQGEKLLGDDGKISADADKYVANAFQLIEIPFGGGDAAVTAKLADAAVADYTVIDVSGTAKVDFAKKLVKTDTVALLYNTANKNVTVYITAHN